MISFGGSTRAGRLISKNAADTIKVCLELGGKGGNIVFSDVSNAVRDGVRNIMSNSGRHVMHLQECLLKNQYIKEQLKKLKMKQIKLKLI